MASPPDNYTRTHIKWDGGWLEFDAVFSQQLEHDGEVTEHPVASGANISDHFRIINPPIILEAEITNTPLSLPLTHTEGAQEIQSITEIEIASPIFKGAPTSLFGFDITNKRTVQLSTKNYSPEMNRVKSVYDELMAIRKEPRLVTVALKNIDTFDNLVLKRVTITRDSDTGTNVLPLELEFRKIITAEVTTTEIDVKQPSKKRSTKKTDTGNQGTKESTRQQSTAFILTN